MRDSRISTEARAPLGPMAGEGPLGGLVRSEPEEESGLRDEG
jgi:hypothetical protein